MILNPESQLRKTSCDTIARVGNWELGVGALIIGSWAVIVGSWELLIGILRSTP